MKHRRWLLLSLPLVTLSPFLPFHTLTALVNAILAHAGEASGVRKRFLTLFPSQRADLIAFLQSL